MSTGILALIIFLSGFAIGGKIEQEQCSKTETQELEKNE